MFSRTTRRRVPSSRRLFESLEDRLALSVDLAYAGAFIPASDGVFFNREGGWYQGLGLDDEGNAYVVADSRVYYGFEVPFWFNEDPANSSQITEGFSPKVICKIRPDGSTAWSRVFYGEGDGYSGMFDLSAASDKYGNVILVGD